MTRMRKLLIAGMVACMLIPVSGASAAPTEAATPEARFEAQITAFVHYRNSLLVSDNRAVERPTMLGAPAQARLDLAEEQLPKMRSLMAELGEEYRNSQTEITVLETTPVDSTTTEVLYREFTTISLKLPGGEKAPEDTGYVEDYVATFTKEHGNDWQLDSVVLANEVLLPPMTEPIEGREVSASADEFYQKLADYDRAMEGIDFGPDGPPDPLSPQNQASLPSEDLAAVGGFGLGEGGATTTGWKATRGLGPRLSISSSSRGAIGPPRGTVSGTFRWETRRALTRTATVSETTRCSSNGARVQVCPT